MFLVLLLLFAIQGLLNAMTCSSECSSLCQKIQISCTVCLNTYYQTINSATRDCSCINGYQPFKGLDTYCCPIGCRSCNKQGCTQCYSNQILQYNSTLKTNICVCKQHYILNKNGQCVCFSQISPQTYYFDDFQKQCIACPQNCICNSQGCISCSEQTNRKILKLQSQRSSCHCNDWFREIDGVCQCPKGCNCTDPYMVICPNQTHRYNSTGNCECIWPYQNIGISCQCLFPYIQILNWNNSLSCECSSKKDYSSFFLYKDQCSSCYQGCSCNENGCYQCNVISSISKLNHCYCANNYTIVNSKCQCLFPYYYSSLNQTFCYCLSELDKNNYYYIKSEQKCYACPPGCRCNQNGCISCDNNNLRKIVQLSPTQFICPCVENTQENSEGICSCIQLFIKSNNQCVCNTGALNIFFNDIDTEQCQTCPLSCKCDNTGCYQCSQQSNRVIGESQIGIKTCNCKQKYISQKYSQKCICAGNYTLYFPPEKDQEDDWYYDYDYDYDNDYNYDQDYNYDDNNDSNNETDIPQIIQCRCQLPYYQTDNGQCLCMSQIDSTNYYWDFVNKKCFFCPINCICNDLGCISCSDDALRTISLDLNTNHSICPCLQNSYLNGNYCTICISSQYYYSGSCIPCRGCKTCDRRGCLTCDQQQQNLVGFECICKYADQGFVNNGDYCGCQDGYSRYNSTYSSSCQKCPTYCQVCLITLTQDICLKCPQGVHRANFPSRNCECQDGYIQAYPMQVFCCHYSCQSCNQTSCIICPLYSYRTIVNSTCQCVYPLLEINKGACICDTLYYLMNGTCFKCPQSCKSCSYLPNQSFVRCTSCNQGMNRNMSHINCSCLPGFIETHPIKSPFCVLQHCTQDVVNCQSCLDKRVLNQGQCKCPPSTFQNYLKTCQSCNIEGCFQCQQYLLCYQCDTNNSYFLSNLRCYYSNLTSTSMVFYVGIRKILIQFKLQLKMQQYISSTLSIIRIQSPHSMKVYHAIPLNVQYEHLNEDLVLTTIFQNTNQTYSNLLLSYNITYLSKTQKLTSDKQITIDNISQSTIKYHQQNIYQSVILSTQIMENFNPTQQSSASFAASIFFSIMAYVFYVLGYKHNQLMFYLQCMSFYGFVIDRTPIANVVFLYNLRYSYFNYDRNPLEKVIPINYIENCEGNYFITSTDCNMIRNIGLSLILALTIGILLIVTRIIHHFLRVHFRLDIRFIHYKKLIYRTLEFFHKSTMFPLIFFSIQTLVNAKTTVLIRSDFKTSCNVLASIILVIYFFYTILEIFYNIMSKLYKIQNCIQFLADIFVSIIIIKSQRNETLIGVVVIMVVKDIIYSILRHKYMNQKASYLLLVATIFSIATMAMIISKSNRWGVVSVHVVTGFVHLIIYSLLTYWFFQMGKFDKIILLPIGVASHTDMIKSEFQEQN